MSHKTNNTIHSMVGDGAIVPRMMRTQPVNVEKHGATIPKMQPTSTQASGSVSTTQQASKNSSK